MTRLAGIAMLINSHGAPPQTSRQSSLPARDWQTGPTGVAQTFSIRKDSMKIYLIVPVTLHGVIGKVWGM